MSVFNRTKDEIEMGKYPITMDLVTVVEAVANCNKHKLNAEISASRMTMKIQTANAPKPTNRTTTNDL